MFLFIRVIILGVTQMQLLQSKLFLLLLFSQLIGSQVYSQVPWSKIDKPYIPLLVKSFENGKIDSSLGILLSKYPNENIIIGLYLKSLVVKNIDTLVINKYISKAKELKGTFSLDAIGFYYHNKKNYLAARDYYYQSYLANKDYVNYGVILDLAFLEEDTGNLYEAKKYYELAKNSFPNVYEVMIEIVQYYFNQKMFVEALRLLDSFPSNKNDDYLFIRKGEAYEELGMFDKAKDMYQASLMENPKSSEARFKILCLYIYRYKDLGKAELLLSNLKSDYPDLSVTKFGESILLTETKRYHESNIILKKLIITDPIVTYYGNIAINLILLKEYNESIKFITEGETKYGTEDHFIILKYIAMKGAKDIRLNEFVLETQHQFGDSIFDATKSMCQDLGINYDEIFSK